MAAYYNVGMEHAFSRMTAAAVTALAGGNPYIADATADNAIRNNLMPTLVKAARFARAVYAARKAAVIAGTTTAGIHAVRSGYGEGGLTPLSYIAMEAMEGGPAYGRQVPGFMAAPDYLRGPTVESFPIARLDLRQSVLWTPVPGQVNRGMLEGFSALPAGLSGAQIFTTPVHAGPNMSILMKDGGKDKASGSGIKYPNNPKRNEEKYKRFGTKNRAQENIKDGSVWEKDFSSHGGQQWKHWSSRKSCEKADKPDSIWPDGRIRKKGDT